jgi:hypothetical protein
VAYDRQHFPGGARRPRARASQGDGSCLSSWLLARPARAGIERRRTRKPRRRHQKINVEGIPMTACSRLRPRGLVLEQGRVRALRAAVALALVTMQAVASIPARAQSGDGVAVATVAGPSARTERSAAQPSCAIADGRAEGGCGNGVVPNVASTQALALAATAHDTAVTTPGNDARASEDQASIASRVGAALAAGFLIMAFTGRRRAR